MSLIGYALHLFCVAFSLGGVQFLYSSQFALGGPLFINAFHFSLATTNVIFSTAGPISGFIVQPVVGVISDTYTSKFGKRKPFILVGTIFTALGMALVACSVKIGEALGDNPTGKTPEDHVVGVCFAIAGLWIMNLFANVIQGPSRALVNDVASRNLQLGNAIISAIMAFSAIAANLIGAQFLGQSDSYFVIFLIAASFILFSMFPTLIASPDVPYQRSENEPRRNFISVFKAIFDAFRSMPGAMGKVVLAYFFSWVAFTPLMLNQTLLFQKVVYRGPQTLGLLMGLYSLALFSTVQFTFSLVLPLLVDKKSLGPKWTYILTQIVTTACFVLLWYLDPLKPWEALLFTSLTALNFGVFNSVPFALTTEIVGTDKIGLYMGVLNSASVVAQTVSGQLSNPVLTYMHDSRISTSDDPRYALLLVGAVFSLLAVIAAFFIEPAPHDGAQLQTLKQDSDEEARRPLVGTEK